MISYAQNFEDLVLHRVFRGQKNGFYIDMGPMGPVLESVTKFFYDEGWSGINIEPNECPRAVSPSCAYQCFTGSR